MVVFLPSISAPTLSTQLVRGLFDVEDGAQVLPAHALVLDHPARREYIVSA